LFKAIGKEIADRYRDAGVQRIVTIEDGVRNGGLGSAVTEWMNDHGYSIPITRMGLPDNFVEHGTVQELKQICGIDVGSIKKVLTSEKG